MSFGLVLSTCHLGSVQREKEKIKNPFTKEDMDIDVFEDKGLTASEKKAVKELIDQAKSEEGEAGPYEGLDLRFPDGGVVEVWAGGLETEDKFDGFSFTVWAATPHVAKLLFKLSQVGNLVIGSSEDLGGKFDQPGFPPGKSIDPWVTSANQQKLVAARWPNAKVIASEQQMQRELEQAAAILEVED
jgi:hypothetical protein